MHKVTTERNDSSTSKHFHNKQFLALYLTYTFTLHAQVWLVAFCRKNSSCRLLCLPEKIFLSSARETEKKNICSLLANKNFSADGKHLEAKNFTADGKHAK